ncbi:MAG: PA2779 family protein [Wenzhouxiangella sp.]
MIRKNLRGKLCVLILSLALLPLATAQAAGGLISSQEALAIERTGSVEQVQAWLQQDQVAAELTALGVDPALAQARVAAMSPDEVAAMLDRIDEMPAGAGVIEVLGITFLVLIILDLIGVINIFGR